MTAYTIAIRENALKPWLFVGQDLVVRDTTAGCKPLSKEAAMLAKGHMIATAAKAGRPVECRIVRLVKE